MIPKLVPNLGKGPYEGNAGPMGPQRIDSLSVLFLFSGLISALSGLWWRRPLGGSLRAGLSDR